MTRSRLPLSSSTLEKVNGRRWSIVGTGSVQLVFPAGPVFVLDETQGQHYVLPGDPTVSGADKAPLQGKGRCWVLPISVDSPDDRAWLIEAESSDTPIWTRYSECQPSGAGAETESAEPKTIVTVTVLGQAATLISHAPRPHADVHGAEYALDFPGGRELADALAGFYWGTMLPCVVERTRASTYPDWSGFVISTLADKYVGTYPDVDHEFQIKGRLAAGSALDLDVVRRMMELQLRLMREDPCGLWRDPCAVQPSGVREYHVRRNSLDGRENAVMFLVTGNIEIVESVWLYVARTKDIGWLRLNLDDLEGALSCVEGCIDPLGRLWSDVYYEDQVIKDGRETLAAALAMRSFELMAELESLLERREQAERYAELARKLRVAISKPLPVGYWDGEHSRFIDWVDRSGNVHDHLHLLANELPVLFGAASPEQEKAVLDLLRREEHEYQRFPSFLAARIADYTPSEIGDGGPYDLCAAGRYWRDGYVMGERYDMNHVYYKDGPPWHGAAHYYEYPCVFAWVLMVEYLGIRATLGPADLRIAPHVDGPCSVTLNQWTYRLRYEYCPGDWEAGGSELPCFALQNLASASRVFELDLGAIFPEGSKLLIRHGHIDEEAAVFDGAPITVDPGARFSISPENR
ncbi:hypothetical protein MAPG_03664 [Magnaporthiopsis poae ATCC 64411]|uniref:Alpha-L-rhamnosidase six-hairpin glycosidase domain-containing protein n=1 Tax=Magnaporthiopsis poae (strain ATCC 64411 / 73-15) TaxID=644358 RepID=A0A0C4DUM4_MAGP6|nr:hypothetical protein MAPG_03664 [Magnaporthiopsis poae ATCC 64411]